MTSIPNCDKALISELLKESSRIDGRGLTDYRTLQYEFAPDSSSCLLHLGNTKVLSVVNAEIGPPKQGRDHQGSITFKLGFDPNLITDANLFGNAREHSLMLTRWLERLFFMGNALDREALCIVAGKMVWHLEVNVRIVDHDGNLIDACVLSVLGALTVFRRPWVTQEGTEETRFIKHAVEEREPLPLMLHHLPIAVSFAHFHPIEGLTDAYVVDPNLKETSTAAGALTCVVDPQGNLLNIQKLYGIPLSPSIILMCCKIAAEKVQEIAKTLQEALKRHEAERIHSRIIRLDPQRHPDFNVHTTRQPTD